MAQPTQPACLSQVEMEAFTVLVLRYLDGGCGAKEIEQLNRVMTGSASNRELFVQICRMHGNLHEAYAPKRAELQHRVADAQQTLPASAPEGQTAGKAAARSGAKNPASAPSSHNPRVMPDDPLTTGDIALEQESSPDTATGDPAASTIIRELSGEDTIHSVPKAPEP